MNLDELVDAARQEPPRADWLARARMRAAVADRASGRSGAARSRGPGRPAPRTLRTMVLAAAAVLFVVGTGFAMVEWRAHGTLGPRAPTFTPLPETLPRAPGAPAAPATTPPELLVASPRPAPPPPEPRAATAPRRELRKASGPPADLEAELATLRDVRAALGSGDRAAALDALDRYDARFKRGTLRQEAEALRIFALCDTGRMAEARARGAVFFNRWPQSPMRARVEASCAGSPASAP